MKLDSRRTVRLYLFNALPLALVVFPAAVLCNLWVFFDDAAFYGKTSVLCAAFVMIGLSLTFLTLPEILRVFRRDVVGLLQLVALATTIAGLLCAIAILVAMKVGMPILILLLLTGLGGWGLVYTVKNWTIWSAK